VEEVMVNHRKAEATFGESATSELRPIQFKVQIFVGTIFETRNTKFFEEYVIFPLLNGSQVSILSVGYGIRFCVRGKRFLSSQQHTDWLWSPPNLLFSK
jgi:hypothetical protein